MRNTNKYIIGRNYKVSINPQIFSQVVIRGLCGKHNATFTTLTLTRSKKNWGEILRVVYLLGENLNVVLLGLQSVLHCLIQVFNLNFIS